MGQDKNAFFAYFSVFGLSHYCVCKRKPYVFICFLTTIWTFTTSNTERDIREQREGGFRIRSFLFCFASVEPRTDISNLIKTVE